MSRTFFKNDAVLYNVNIKTQSDGLQVEELTDEKQILCNIKSLTRSEFYQSRSSGFNPVLVIEVQPIEYNKQKYCKIANDEEVYRVLRTYLNQRTKLLELTLETIENAERYVYD